MLRPELHLNLLPLLLSLRLLLLLRFLQQVLLIPQRERELQLRHILSSRVL